MVTPHHPHGSMSAPKCGVQHTHTGIACYISAVILHSRRIQRKSRTAASWTKPHRHGASYVMVNSVVTQHALVALGNFIVFCVCLRVLCEMLHRCLRTTILVFISRRSNCVAPQKHEKKSEREIYARIKFEWFICCIQFFWLIASIIRRLPIQLAMMGAIKHFGLRPIFQFNIWNARVLFCYCFKWPFFLLVCLLFASVFDVAKFCWIFFVSACLSVSWISWARHASRNCGQSSESVLNSEIDISCAAARCEFQTFGNFILVAALTTKKLARRSLDRRRLRRKYFSNNNRV